jgi:tetratricopeptide (TPR) repeat protein
LRRKESSLRSPRLRRAGRIEFAVCLTLAAVAFGLYARTGGFPFTNFDDFDYVVDNPHVAQGLSWSNLAWAFSTLEREFWHPLTWLSYLGDVSLFGLRPGPMHLVNAGFHAASSVLLFIALARLTRAPLRSACVAALFAVHPMHVESVAWISERKDVLSVFFGLLALIAYTRYARRPTLRRMAPVVAAFAASLMAKSTLVTLPFLLLLLDAWPLGRLPARWTDGSTPASNIPKIGWARAVLEKLPLLAMAVASAWLTMVAQTRGGTVVSDPSDHRLDNVIVSYVRYVGKLLWPADLAVFYPLRSPGEPTWEVLAALAALVLVTALAVAARRRAPWLTVGWLWFAGTLVPVSGLVRVGSHAMADRYTYFPSIGLFIALVWGVGHVRWRPMARVAPAAAVGVLGVLAVLADRQVRLWSDDEQLFRHAISATGPNVRAQELLANVLQNRGRNEEAHEHLLEAVRILPNPRSFTALGAVSVKLGRKGSAEKAYELALAMDPQRDEAALALSGLLAQDGREADATEVLARAASAWPRAGSSSIPRRIDLAAALVERGKVDEGITVLQGVLARAPGEPEASSILSQAYFNRGDQELAERYALQALAGGSRNAGALLVLGAVRLSRNDAAGAVEVLGRAVELDPGEPFRRLLLGSALASLGRRAEACADLELVLRSPRSTGEDRERAAQEARGEGCAATAP